MLQPNYIPWRGYFELMNEADIFVFLDDVQYTRRDWRNRNQIKTEQGIKWLTVPVVKRSRDALLIKDVEIDNTTNWGQAHYDALKQSYSRAPHFSEFTGLLEDMYKTSWDNLCEFDIQFLYRISEYLGINTKFTRSSELGIGSSKDDKLIGICESVGISTYISGPSGANYIEPMKFQAHNIELAYHQYDYPAYQQLYGEFQPNVSILDLLFNCGENSSRYIWSDQQP